jgi:hypothetical protein
MNCEQLREQLDDYADGLLSADQVLAMQSHAADCSHCQSLLAQQEAMIQALRTMPTPPMRPGFTQQSLKRAVEHKQHHRRGFATGFSSALAASVALWVVVSFMMPPEQLQSPAQAQLQTQPEGVAQVSLALYQESTVNLVFYSPKPVSDAKLSITLPENVEVVGFPGERVISWQTALTEGQNILPLPLKANAAVNSQLLASIESGSSKKTFRLQIGVSESGRTGLPAPVLKNMV